MQIQNQQNQKKKDSRDNEEASQIADDAHQLTESGATGAQVHRSTVVAAACKEIDCTESHAETVGPCKTEPNKISYCREKT